MGLESERCGWESSGAVVLPIPYHATTSWGAGTREGPAAILEASRYVELYDEELDREPVEVGICTLPAVQMSLSGPRAAISSLSALYADLLEVAGDRFVIGLGGEHSISSAPATAWVDRLGADVSILQFDAHSDLRAEYHGTPWNHACVMRRILDRTDRIVAVGIRALTSEERAVIREARIPTIFAHEMRSEGWQALDLLREVFRTRTVVGADVVELAPRRGEEASAFTAAKLVYKMIGLWTEYRAG